MSGGHGIRARGAGQLQSVLVSGCETLIPHFTIGMPLTTEPEILEVHPLRCLMPLTNGCHCVSIIYCCITNYFILLAILCVRNSGKGQPGNLSLIHMALAGRGGGWRIHFPDGSITHMSATSVLLVLPCHLPYPPSILPSRDSPYDLG